MGAEAETQKISAPEGFDGPVQRKCTDVLFMILLVAAWIAMTVVGADAVSRGNPAMLINGMDYMGNTCGVTANYTDVSKLYYVNYNGNGVCVASCPKTTDFNNLYACKTASNVQYTVGGSNPIDCSTGNGPAECAYYTGVASTSNFAASTGDGDCMYQIETIDFLNHCVISDETIAEQFVDVTDETVFLQKFMSDIYVARYWILGFGFCFSFVIGVMYCYLLRIPGLVTIMTWTSIFATIGLTVAIGIGFWKVALDWEDDTAVAHSSYQINAAKGFAIVFWICAGLFFCLIVFLRKRIALATGVMKESATALNAIPTVFFTSVIQAAGLIAFFIPLTYYGVNVASIGTYTKDPTTGYVSIDYDNQEVESAWYLLFCLFWTHEFIQALGQIIVALAICKFYFSRDRSKVNAGTYFKALKDACWYHTGTAAFGGLIIAIIKMIRAVIAYFQKQAKTTQNKIMSAVLCCCQCCFWCLEKCMKFMNKNAYIQTALFSTSFCTSAQKAFGLIARNIARVSAVSMVTEFICIIMKFVICFATIGATYLAMNATIVDDLYSIISPSIFVGVLAYMVAGVFAEMFSMTTSTILQCFIADEEMFAPGERYASPNLLEFMEGTKKKQAPLQTQKPASPAATNGASPAGIVASTGTKI